MKLFCPICGKQEAQHKTITETFNYKGYKIPIEDYDVIHCSNCGETLVRQETMKNTEQILRNFKNEIDKRIDNEKH